MPMRGGRRKGGAAKKVARKKICKLCLDRVEAVDYKDERRLYRAITDRGKMVPRRISGTCAAHQRKLTVGIKRARNIALLPYTTSVSP